MWASIWTIWDEDSVRQQELVNNLTGWILFLSKMPFSIDKWQMAVCSKIASDRLSWNGWYRNPSAGQTPLNASSTAKVGKWCKAHKLKFQSFYVDIQVQNLKVIRLRATSNSVGGESNCHKVGPAHFVLFVTLWGFKCIRGKLSVIHSFLLKAALKCNAVEVRWGVQSYVSSSSEAASCRQQRCAAEQLSWGTLAQNRQKAFLSVCCGGIEMQSMKKTHPRY